jgi:hypothetical protein
VRRGDPDRIYQAQRAGVFMRLTRNERVNELEAEQLIARWEREAEAIGRSPGSVDYWDDAWRWIEDQRHPQNVVKPDMGVESEDGQVFVG